MIRSEFFFRGDRRYLHSATVLNFILHRIPGSHEDIDFEFSTKTAKQVMFVFPGDESQGTRVGRYSDSDTRIDIYETAEPITESEPYPESELAFHFEVMGDRVRIPLAGEDFTAIDKIVAAFKYLLTFKFPENKKKYAFARLKLDRLPARVFFIEYKRRISKAFYDGSIEEDGQQIGSIYFGEWEC
jgi:hypothetical protein